MKENTVTLSLKVYNDLRDFKSEIQKNNAVKIINGWDFNERLVFVGEFPKYIIDKNENLVKENNDLRSENLKFYNELKDIKKMSIWEFRRWKRSP